MLDETGDTPGSVAFADKLGKWRDDGVREVRFLIGAADGFDDAERAEADCCCRSGGDLAAHAGPRDACRAIVARDQHPCQSSLSPRRIARCGPRSSSRPCALRGRADRARRATRRSAPSPTSSAGWSSARAIAPPPPSARPSSTPPPRRTRRGRQSAAEEQALAAKVQQAQADIAAATARIALVDRLLGDSAAARRAAGADRAADRGALLARAPAQRGRGDAARIGRRSRPCPRGARQHAARGPGAHRRAARRARPHRRLRADAVLAAQSLTDSRRRLETNRIALAPARGRAPPQVASAQPRRARRSDRAIGLGERARDLVDQMQTTTTPRRPARALAELPGPLPRPAQPGEIAAGALSWTTASAPYRLPVTGKLVTGFGEVSDAGVPSRGLTFAVAGRGRRRRARGGQMVYAGPFRDYGTIVIIDHGGGWTTLIAGLRHAYRSPLGAAGRRKARRSALAPGRRRPPRHRRTAPQAAARSTRAADWLGSQTPLRAHP